MVKIVKVVMEKHGFALRTDLQLYGLEARLGVWLDNQSTANYWMVREDLFGINAHCHIYFESDHSLNALRLHFKRTFPELVGNGSYSLKPCDNNVEDYWKYMAKGEAEGDYPDVYLRQGYQWTEEKVVELHEAYWCTNTQLKATSKKRDTLKLRGTVVEQVEREAKEQKLNGRDREAIAKIYIRMYVTARKPLSVFHAKGVVNTVCCILDGDSVDLLASDIASRY